MNDRTPTNESDYLIDMLTNYIDLTDIQSLSTDFLLHLVNEIIPENQKEKGYLSVPRANGYYSHYNNRKFYQDALVWEIGNFQNYRQSDLTHWSYFKGELKNDLLLWVKFKSNKDLRIEILNKLELLLKENVSEKEYDLAHTKQQLIENLKKII
jgi:hypothetical protein